MNFWKQFGILVLLVGIGFVILGTFTVALKAFGMSLVSTESLHIAQWLQTFCVMIGAPLAWAWWFYGRKSRPMSLPWRSVCDALWFRPASVRHIALSAILMVAILPFADFLEVTCTRMPMPDALRDYCHAGYVANQRLMEVILRPTGLLGWTELVLLMCVFTAIGEELMFRGALLGCFVRGGGVRWHAAAWIVGLIFSLAHFEPMGFVPRWLLGTLFAYMVCWSGSLWPGILAHCINNLVALVSYKMASPEEMLSPVKEYSFGPVLTVCSFVVSALLLWQFWRLRQSKTA